MLYVFCGNRFAAREHVRKFVAICKEKRPHAEYIHFSPTGDTPLEELLFGQGLFEKKYIIFCDEVLVSPVSGHLLDNLSSYHSSPHMFILFEPALKTSEEKKLTTCGAVVKRCVEEGEQEDTRTLFSFADTFLRRDSEKTFITLHILLRKGVSPVSLLNILLWQLRMLVLVSKTKDASEAGISPFVYQKTKRALPLFTDPFTFFLTVEQTVRRERLSGATDEEIIEYLSISS